MNLKNIFLIFAFIIPIICNGSELDQEKFDRVLSNLPESLLECRDVEDFGFNFDLGINCNRTFFLYSLIDFAKGKSNFRENDIAGMKSVINHYFDGDLTLPKSKLTKEKCSIERIQCHFPNGRIITPYEFSLKSK